MRNLSNDVYFQVGLLTTVGLSVKNAILIVEFAKAFFEEGELSGGSRHQSGPGAFAPNSDDLHRLCFRGSAACLRLGRGCLLA